VEETYSSKTKSEPSIEELAEIIGVSEKRIREAKKYDLTMVSFDKPIMNNDEDNDSTLGDFLTSDAIEAPEKGSEDQAEHEVYEFLLNKLIEKKGVTKPERTVQVIRLRYGSELYNEETYKLIKKYNLPFKEKYTLKDVGKIFGVTRERIRQLQAKGIDKMIDYTELYNVDIYERENYKQKLKRRLLKEEEYQEKIKRGQEKKEEE
jgi:RNA polymerase primary sigma factor